MNDSGDSITALQKMPPKKKRNLAGTPDPDAEVITLSPNTLLATNRFVCEICNKGFQRDQNLQLHRRGHNLPWKLRQRSGNDIKKRVYVCPVSSCVHHLPSRALGDLTGIKKHYCRKHGEKKWKCDKCSKNYAVQSDWKAHSKICGSREYKCDCGTVFSRKDSLIKHRTYCDALVEETGKGQTKGDDKNTNFVEAVRLSPPSSATATPPPPVMSSIPEIRSPDQSLSEIPSLTSLTASCSTSSCTNGSSTSNAFTSLFASSTSSETFHSQKTFQLQPPCIEPTNQGQSIFGSHQFNPSPHPAMSATALLQKAAQMGPAVPSESLLWGLGVVSSSSGPSGLEPDGGLCLSLRCDGGSGLKELMRGSTTMFGPTRTTLDLLGLGMAASGGSSGGLAALMTSVGGCIDAVPPFGRDNC